MAGREQSEREAAKSLSPEDPQDKGINNLKPKDEATASYASKLHELGKKFDPGEGDWE